MNEAPDMSANGIQDLSGLDTEFQLDQPLATDDCIALHRQLQAKQQDIGQELARLAKEKVCMAMFRTTGQCYWAHTMQRISSILYATCLWR